MTSLPVLALVFALGFVARIFVEAHSKINRDLKSMERYAQFQGRWISRDEYENGLF